MHKKLRRTKLAPKMRVPKGEVVTEPDDTLAAGEENLIDLGEDNNDPNMLCAEQSPMTVLLQN